MRNSSGGCRRPRPRIQAGVEAIVIPGAHYFEDSIAERRNAADLVSAWIREKL